MSERARMESSSTIDNYQVENFSGSVGGMRQLRESDLERDLQTETKETARQEALRNQPARSVRAVRGVVLHHRVRVEDVVQIEQALDACRPDGKRLRDAQIQLVRIVEEHRTGLDDVERDAA